MERAEANPAGNKKARPGGDGLRVAVLPGRRFGLPHHARSAPTRRAVAMMRMMVGEAGRKHDGGRLVGTDRGVKGGFARTSGLGAPPVCE